MDYFSQEERKKFKKPIIIGGAVVAVLAIIGIALFVFLRFEKAPVASTPPVSQNMNNQSMDLSQPDGFSSYNLPPGLNRPLTEDEKAKYHFPADVDVWIRTTNPTDGSKPLVFFSQGPKVK